LAGTVHKDQRILGHWGRTMRNITPSAGELARRVDPKFFYDYIEKRINQGKKKKIRAPPPRSEWQRKREVNRFVRDGKTDLRKKNGDPRSGWQKTFR